MVGYTVSISYYITLTLASPPTFIRQQINIQIRHPKFTKPTSFLQHVRYSSNFPTWYALESRVLLTAPSERSLVKAILPPSVLVRTNRNAEEMDWMSLQVVDPDQIAKARITIESSYPRRKHEGGQSPYPDKDLKGSIGLHPRNHIQAKFYADEIYHRYNPFGLRLPFGLRELDMFFNSNFFNEGDYLYLRKETANEQYLNFLREYHLLYVDILEAINDSSEAIKRIETKVDTNKMYQNAGIEIMHLKRKSPVDTSSVDFRRSLVAYLVLDILRSPDANISTAARVKALRLLDCFNIDFIASAFSKNSLGLCVSEGEPVEDLLPRSFMTTAREKGGTPHNKLFIKNSKIRELFYMESRGSGKCFDPGLSVLLHHHQKETVQVLISLLRCHTWGWSKHLAKLVFHALFNLTKLDSIQKEELFGASASYRADCQPAGSSGLQSRVGATTGTGGGFGDGLETLSREELIVRVRQHQAYEQMREDLSR